ncbi:MAG: DNA gyrase inhibitor YacG [Holophaga sp.]|nr:DNA gyrase inhibitor YacG [Holophaga sp.]
MPERPCPICRKPVLWETTPTRPFCSERCKTRDLGAWSSENYRVEVVPGSEDDEDSQDASPSSEAF